VLCCAAVQAERALGTPVAGTARGVAGSVPVLQIEGPGYIKHLEHGLPVTRKGLHDARIESVDDEPVLLTDPGMAAVVVSNLGVAPRGGRLTAACHYEVVVSGFAVGGHCDKSSCVANGHYSVTPAANGAIAVRDLAAAPLLMAEGGGAAAEMALRPEVRKGGELWLHSAQRPVEIELLVSVSRVGNGCLAAAVAGV
jgi:hypothetical protein